MESLWDNLVKTLWTLKCNVKYIAEMLNIIQNSWAAIPFRKIRDQNSRQSFGERLVAEISVFFTQLVVNFSQLF